MESGRRRSSRSASDVEDVHQQNRKHNEAASRLSTVSPPCFDWCLKNDTSYNRRATGVRMTKEIEPRRRVLSRLLDTCKHASINVPPNRRLYDARYSREPNGTLDSLDGNDVLTKYVSRRDFLCANHSQISSKSSKVSSVEKKKNLTRIVVLRPNHGHNKHHSGTSVSLRRRVPPYDDARFAKPSSKEARRIAREIIRYSSRLRNYAGDENSYDAPESDDQETLNSLSRYYSFGEANKRSRFPSSKHHDHTASLCYSTSNFVKKYRSHEKILSSQDSKSRNMMKPLPYKQQISADYFDTKTGANVQDLSEKQLMLSEPGNKTLCFNSSVIDNNDEAAASDQENSCIQELHEEGCPSLQHQDTAVLASSESWKDAENASPVLVVESTFKEDAPFSSESFKKVGAEKNEINYTLKAESWESSYAVDVLIHSSLLRLGFDMFRTKWYSPDCPLDPLLFDDLEKKYDKEITWLRSERRLLFDRINSALLGIFQQRIDLCRWVRPKLAGLYYPICPKELARDVIEKLAKQESVNGQEQERELDREMQWLDGEGEMDEVGDVIVRLLIFDMMRELSW